MFSRTNRTQKAWKIWLLIASSIISMELYAQDGSKSDSESSTIQLLLLMFILTLIAERIANFFKFYWSDTRTGSGKANRFRKLFGFGNMARKRNDEAEEKNREYRILKVSILFGCVTAIIFRADLFAILHNLDDPSSNLGWETMQQCSLGAILITIVGCCFTGVFLSFGSKFWHDLIDLILQIKNYKRMLTKEGLKEMGNKFSELPNDEQDAILRAAIAENYDSWKAQYPNIVGAEIGLKKVEGRQIPEKALIFLVRRKLADDQLSKSEIIPDRLMYGGRWLATDVVEKPIAVAQSQILHPGHIYAPARIGTNISRTNFSNFGTIGLKVTRKIDAETTQHYLITCFHVLFPDQIVKPPQQGKTDIQIKVSYASKSYPATTPGWDFANSNRVRVALKSHAVEGHLSPQLDVALARIAAKDLENRTFEYDTGKSITVKSAIPRNEITEALEVYCYGSVSGRKRGRIEVVSVSKTDVELTTTNGSAYIQTFDNLIRTSKISDPGDSGAVVLDGNGRVLGIILAGDDQYSYVLPFHSIQNLLSVNL
ncbi:MAG: hypothetical protein ACK4E0_15410 [Chitinophagaceae bacterium]